MGSAFAATNLVVLSDFSNISYGKLRGVFSREGKNFYRDDDFEIWRISSNDIYTGRPRGRGF